MSTKNPDAGKAVANRAQESRPAGRPPEAPGQPKSEPSGAATEAGPGMREGAGPARRWLPRLILGILVIGGAGAAYSWYRSAHRSPDESRLDLQGNIDVRQVQLSFKVGGRIETLAVDEGDAVAAEQVMATLDKRYFDDDLRLARARRDNAAANLARLEHGSRPEEIAAARAQVAQQRATVAREKGLRARRGTGRHGRREPRNLRPGQGGLGRGGSAIGVRGTIVAAGRDRTPPGRHRRRAPSLRARRPRWSNRSAAWRIAS